MKKLQKFHIFIVLLLVLSGCRKDQWNDCFQGTGKDVTETRLLGSFSKITIGEKFDILLVQDTTQPEQVKITAGEHIIKQLITEVNNNTLTIKDHNTCNFVRSYNRKIVIEIRVKFLDNIELFSVSNFTAPDTLHFELKTVKLKNLGLGNVNLKINAGILDVQSINSGNIFLEGFVNVLSCSIEEVSVLDARKLLCDDVYLDSHTPLDCFVNPKNILKVNIFNKGNVFYVNKPPNCELTEQRGTGQLLKL
jgi:hypothetical protein